MGRVNVETRALAETRFIHFAEDLNEGGRVGAIGLLVIFWHDTQERGLVEGTREEIEKLIPYRDESLKHSTFDLLLRHDYVKRTSSSTHRTNIEQNEQYVISGNRKQIDGFQRHIDKTRAAGIASGKSRRKQQHRTSSSTQRTTSSSAEGNSIQFNTDQYINTSEPRGTRSVSLDPPPDPFPFETEIYARYPRKVGKSAGLKTCRKAVKTPEDFEALKTALRRYLEYLTTQKIDPQYVLHFSTFANQWRDWLEPNAGQTAAAPRPVLTFGRETE